MKIRTMFLLVSALYFSAPASADMTEELLDLQHEWAKTSYETSEDNIDDAFESLTTHARTLVTKYPDSTEPKVWLAIVLSSDAGATGGISALRKVNEAKKLLEDVKTKDPTILNGSVYTSLGSLYYKVPGWPLSFGNKDKAEHYLKMALTTNPDGIDPNYFYGDFLLEKGNADAAIVYLEKALNAPPRENRLLADRGRKNEIKAKLGKAKLALQTESD